MAYLFNSVIKYFQRKRNCHSVQFEEILKLRQDLKHLEKMSRGLKQNLTICEDVSFNKIRDLTRCLENSSGEIDILKHELIGKEKKIIKGVAIELTEKYMEQIKHLIEKLTKDHNEHIIASVSDTEYHSASLKKQMEDSSTKSSSEIDPSTKSSSEIDPSTKSSSEIDPSTKSSCEIDPSTKYSNEIDPSTKSSSEIDPSTKSSCEINLSTKSSCEINLSTKCSCEIDPSTKYSREIDSSSDSQMENNDSCDDGYETNSIMKNCDARNAELRRYKIDAEFYLIKLREEQKVSADKQSEICAMKTLNTLLVDELEQMKKFPTDDELKDELKNMQCCLKMRMDDNKRLENDLCQMKQLLEESDKINQKLEGKISRVDIELKNCEALKRSCDEICNNLSIQCSDLQLDLATEKKDNREKAKTIDDLCEKTHYLKDVITRLNNQMLLNEEKANARIDDLTTEKDRVTCENKQLKNDIVKLCKYTESLRYKQAEMESKYNELEADKCKLGKNIDNLKEDLKCTLENEIEVEKKLSVANKEIKILKMSIECYEKTAEKERKKLVRAEQQLQDTIMAQLSMHGWNQECLTCVDTENEGIPLSSRHDELSLENEELTKTNALLSDKIACLEESVQTLRCTNNGLTETIENNDDEMKIRRCHAESMTHFDLQTDPCPAVECSHVSLQTDTCPVVECSHVSLQTDTCPHVCDSPCDCKGNSDGTSDRNSDGKSYEPAVSSDSVADCAGGVVEACDSSTSCDRASVAATNSDLLETNRLLRCELDEMKQSYEQNEADMVRRRIEMKLEVKRCRDEIESLKRSCEQNGADTERRRCEVELEVKGYRDEIESLKRSCEQNEADTELRRCEMEWKLINCRKEIESQTVSRMAELTVQLEAYATLVARLEKDLTNCHDKINQLKKDSAEFEEMRKIQEQLKDENELKESLENKSAFDYWVETTVQKNVSSKKDWNDDLNNEIKSNGKKIACKKKSEKKVTKKPFNYGPRIDLPCCIGSENPCDRPELVEKLNSRRATMQNLQAPNNQHRRLAAGGNNQPSSVAKCAPLSKEMIELLSKELDKRAYANSANKSRSTRTK